MELVDMVSTRFTTLPPRSPTPPRDVSKDVDEALRFLETGHDDTTAMDMTATSAAAAEEPSANVSLGEDGIPSSARGASVTKRVDFLEHAPSQTTPVHAASGGQDLANKGHTPLSARQMKPLKSILKATHDPSPPTPEDLDTRLGYFSPQEPGSSRRFIQSILHLLASPSRDQRWDAYKTINGTLKTYEGVPDAEILVEQIPLFCQFLTRDIAWKDGSGKLDSAIVNSALQLTITLTTDTRTLQALDIDFRSFVLDRSISILEQEDISKTVIKSHVCLLCRTFIGIVMTPGRADKLVSALATLPTRCTGNSVISARLVAYQRMIEFAPQTMLSRMRDWLENVFHGLLSTIGDIRTRAIETCTAAALRLGTHAQSCRIVHDIFERTAEDGQSYIELFRSQMTRMSADKDLRAFVPQIWTAIILFWRSKRMPVSRWPRFRAWLSILQPCLNSANPMVKHAANVAWNKMVFTVMPTQSTPDIVRTLLIVPIVKGLERKGGDKVSAQFRQIAMDSYCNLLHYALRPELSHEELDVAFDMYMEPVMAEMTDCRTKCSDSANNLVRGLLLKKTGAWNRDAAIEPGSIKPEELPRLDPRWLRSRFDKFLRLIEPALHDHMRTASPTRSTVCENWRLLLEAVAEAGSQEVKASNELKQVMAHTTNLFRRLWSSATATESTTDCRPSLADYRLLLETTITTLGLGHFVDDLLSRTATDDIEAALTPAHRISKHGPTAYPPFFFLLALYCQPLRVVDTERSIAWLVKLLSPAKGSPASTVALMHRCLKFCFDVAGHDNLAETRVCVWLSLAEETHKALNLQMSASPSHSTYMLGTTLRSCVEIVEMGVNLSASGDPCLVKSLELLSTSCNLAKKYAAEGGVAMGVLEPMCRTLLEGSEDLLIPHGLAVGEAVLKNAVWPKSRQALEQSRKTLWATSLELPRSPAFDPYDNVYTLLNRLLTRAYEEVDALPSSIVRALDSCFDALSDFLCRCPTNVTSVCLARLQASIALWVEDRRGHAFTASANMGISATILNLWTRSLRALERVSVKDSSLLKSLELLMVAGFSSRSRTVVNHTILFWDATFGIGSMLEYPSRLESVLRVRKAQTDIQLPGFPPADDEAILIDLPDFADSQPETRTLDGGIPTVRESQSKSLAAEDLTNEFVTDEYPSLDGPDLEVFVHAHQPSFPESTSRRRPRHDDSQIDFAPIRHSPSLDVDDSQLMTEHQREARARQHEEVLMFPEMSSSPANTEDHILRRLFFHPHTTPVKQTETSGTPTGPTDCQHMSEDLPSSPTPRASSQSCITDLAAADAEDGDEAECDPPSSPPRRDEDAIMEPQASSSLDSDVDASVLGVEEDTTSVAEDVQQGAEEIFADLPERDARKYDDTSLHMDTQLPAVRQQREQKVVETISLATQHGAHHGARSDLPAATADSSRQPFTEAKQDSVEDGEASTFLREDSSAESEIQGRHSVSEMQSSIKAHKGSRKRKRSSEVIHVAKKRKQSYSLNRTLPALLGQSQDDSDDMEDEIIVASRSQPSQEPSTEAYDELIGSSAGVEHPCPPEQPKKRRGGRRRKSRSSSGLGNAEAANGKSSDSKMSIACPNLENLSPVSADGDTVVTQSTPLVEVSSETIRSTRRVTAMVIVRSTQESGECAEARRGEDSRGASAEDYIEEDVEREDTDEESAPQITTPDQQLEQEHRAALRRIAQPKGIMAQLRSVLSKCRKMVIGEEQERELDDMLFHIRKEVFNAGRRGMA